MGSIFINTSARLFLALAVFLVLMLLVAALAEHLEQPDASPQPPTRWAWDARATWPNRLQDAVSFFAGDLDTTDSIQLDLLTLRDFLSQHLEVTFDCLTDEFLSECAFLSSHQGHSIGVFHRDFSFEILKATLER